MCLDLCAAEKIKDYILQSISFIVFCCHGNYEASFDNLCITQNNSVKSKLFDPCHMFDLNHPRYIKVFLIFLHFYIMGVFMEISIFSTTVRYGAFRPHS